MASAIVAVVGAVAASAASGAAVAAGFTVLGSAALGGALVGAVVGGVISAAGAALMGGDVGKAFLTGAVTGAIAGGIAGWSKGASMASESAEATSEATKMAGSEVDTTNFVGADRAASGDPTSQGFGGTIEGKAQAAGGGSPVGGTGDVAGAVESSAAPVIKGEATSAQVVADQPKGLIGKTWSGLGEKGQGALIEGGMKLAGGMLTGSGEEDAAKEAKEAQLDLERARWANESKVDAEKRARMGNMANANLGQFTLPEVTSFESKYV